MQLTFGWATVPNNGKQKHIPTEETYVLLLETQKDVSGLALQPLDSCLISFHIA
jgi:hypothetical protein